MDLSTLRRLTRVAFFSALGLTLAAAVLRTVAFLTAYDGLIGYFSAGASAVTVMYRILAAVAVLATAVCARLIPADRTAALRLPTGADPLAILPFPALLLTAFYTLYSVYNATATSNILWTICGVTALIGAGFFLLRLLGCGSRTGLALTGLCILPAMILIIALTYGDATVTMNSPVKLAVQFAALGIMLAAVTELRFLSGIPAPRLAIVSLAVTTFLCLGGALPCLIARLVGSIPADRPEGQGLYLTFLLAATLYGLYAAAQLYRLCFRLPEPEPEPEPEAEPEATQESEPTPEPEPTEPQAPSSDESAPL